MDIVKLEAAELAVKLTANGPLICLRFWKQPVSTANSLLFHSTPSVDENLMLLLFSIP